VLERVAPQAPCEIRRRTCQGVSITRRKTKPTSQPETCRVEKGIIIFVGTESEFHETRTGFACEFLGAGKILGASGFCSMNVPRTSAIRTRFTRGRIFASRGKGPKGVILPAANSVQLVKRSTKLPLMSRKHLAIVATTEFT